MLNLTVVINTKNEAKNLGVCLKSIQKLKAQVLVVDMGSTDETVKIAKAHGAKVMPYKTDHGFADPARNWAFAQVETDWILVLDADEELSPDLIYFIEEVVEEPSADVYYIPRQNLIFGKWIAHTGWWPDFQPRLFRAGYLEWPGKVHAAPLTKGKIQYLPEKAELAIIHHNYLSLEHFFGKLNRYTSLAAEADLEGKASAPATEAQVFERFFGEFLRRYFAGEGHKDGVHGAALSLLQSTYELTTYLKKWEMGEYPVSEADEDSGVKRLRLLQKELNYWIADYEVQKSVGLAKIYWTLRRKFLL